MNSHLKFFLPIFSLTALGFSLTAQTQATVTRAEYEALAERVAQLEAHLNGLQTQPLDTLTQEVLAAMPEQAKGEASLIETVVAAVKQREQEVKFPWMDMAKWAPIRKGLTPAEVVEFLGDPTLDEPSLHRRIDFVYTYQGRRPATNQRVEGKIRFYKGVVVEVELPVID
jgi:cell division protein FtsB